MGVREQILEDIKTAMKSGDHFRRDSLRMLNAALKQVEVDERISLSDERVFSILQSEIKRRNDSAEQYRAGGRDDLVQKEQGEIEIIASYLPAQLSDAELAAEAGVRACVIELIAHTLAKNEAARAYAV